MTTDAKALTQLNLSHWPSSLTEEVAVLRQEVADFEQSRLVQFEETFDDLDYYKAAIVTLPNGRAFALKRYKNCPSPGLSLIVEHRQDTSPQVQIVEALAALGISNDSVVWLRG